MNAALKQMETHTDSAPARPVPSGQTNVAGATAPPPLRDLVRRAKAQLDAMAGAVQREDGDSCALAKACNIVVRDFGLPRDAALKMLLDWSQRWKAPWTAQEIKENLHDEIRRGTQPMGYLRNYAAPPLAKQPVDTSDAESPKIGRSGLAVVKRRLPKPTQQPVERVSIVTDEVLAETVFDDSLTPPILFAVRRNGQITIERSVTVGGVTYVPPSDKKGLINKGVILLPASPAPYGSQAQLLQKIREFIHRYVDVPSFWEELMAHYVLMTWVYDRFTALPYLRFLGESGTGKSRNLQVVGHLSYKGITAGGATTSSPLFRLIEVYGGTFIIDEADFRNSDQWVEIIKILNCGYMRGLPVLRSAKSRDDYEPRAFDVFGPKILASRSRFSDHAFETRCITLQTEEQPVRKDVPRQLPVVFFQEARELRNKLLQWRFENYNRIEADESKLLHLDPRLTQIATPLYAVSEDAGFRKRLIEFLGESASEERLEMPQAVIVEAIRRLVQRNGSLMTVKGVADETLYVSQDVSDGIPINPKQAGFLIRSLGFKPRRTREGYKFSADSQRLAELVERYCVNL